MRSLKLHRSLVLVLGLTVACFDPEAPENATGEASSSTSGESAEETGETANPSTSEGPTSAGSTSDASTTDATDATSEGPTSVGETSESDTESDSDTESESDTDSTTDDIAECDHYMQNCGPGEKCNPWASDGGTEWNALGCFPVDPAPVGLGDACTVEFGPTSGLDNCGPGAFCWNVNPETNEGVCTETCGGSPAAPTCGSPDETCSILSGGILNICASACDPILQDCPANTGCYPAGSVFACAPDWSGPSGQPGAACDGPNACDIGAVCAAGGVCRPFCDLSSPTCSGGSTCTSWYRDGSSPPGYDDVGVCL